MANITRFDPFGELARIAPFTDDFFRGFALHPVFRSSDIEPQMRIDVKEDDKSYSVKADIPGANKDDIAISVDGNLVTISAEMKREQEAKEGAKVVRSERYYGAVSRSFTLAQDVDEAAAQARYADGVLELTLPKKSGSSRKTIAVS